jgi:DNA topoisomerase IA
MYREKRNSIIADEVLGNGRTYKNVGTDFRLSAQRVAQIVQCMYRAYYLGSLGLLSYPREDYPVVKLIVMRSRYCK